MRPNALRTALGSGALILSSTLSAVPASALESYVYVTEWGGRDVAPGYFNFARSLTTDAQGNVYVADSGNNRIQKFTSTGTLLGYWGSSGSGPGQFQYPAGIAVDTGAVYVADFNNHRIQKFTKSGTYLGQWGHQDTSDGNFEYPFGVTSDNAYVYTAEPSCCSQNNTNRIQKFTTGGGFITSWSGEFDPEDIAADRFGYLFTMEVYRFVRYSIYGSYLNTGGYGIIGGSEGLGVDKFGNVYVADGINNRIEKFSPTGMLMAQWGGYGGGPGQFNYPTDVAVDDSGNVYVSDFSNYRIQKFRRESPPVLLLHGICGRADSWDTFAEVLSDSGFAVDRLQYGLPDDYSLRPSAYVAALAAKLEAMGPHVAVVSHSMGGIIAREYMRRQIASGKPNRISQLVTLGTPHHGSDILAKVLSWGPTVDKLIGGVFGPCLSSPYSNKALLDLVPGAWFLNRLNYGNNTALYDSTKSHGYSAHHSETGLPAGVYLASIAGTGSFCKQPLRDFFWKYGGIYRPNDCTVATGGSLLVNSSAFRAADPDLNLEKPAAHTDNLTTPCGEPYYSFATLAKRVSRILTTSPSGPPVPEPGDPPSLNAVAALDAAEDSLQMAPVIADSISAGQISDRSIVIPATSLVTFTLLSTDAHLSLRDPNGMAITVNDTSSANGVSFFDATDPGFEGFQIVGPLPGTWTLRVDASASGAGQRFAGVVNYMSGSVVQLSLASPLLYPGDSIRLRGQVTTSGVLRTDVTWTCSVLRPDNVTTALTLYDDGIHGDGLAADGIYGSVTAPAGGVGVYALTASASAPSVGPLAAVAYVELADLQDLAIQQADIRLSRNVPQAGDSLTVSAVVHNNSTTAATGVTVEIRDLRTDTVLGTSNVNIGAGNAVTVEAPWVPAAPDSHEIQVSVSPYVLDESSYANNTASRVIVLGSPVGVDLGSLASSLRFDPPRPNPTSAGVVFSFSVPRASAGSLDIFDILGRRVQGWRWTSLQPGSHTIAWDGRGPSGARLATGLYLCRLEVGGQKLQRKIVLRR